MNRFLLQYGYIQWECGEIGRHDGLKIRCCKRRGGSSPPVPIDKDSREHFEIRTHKRLLEIYSDPEVSIVDLLAEVELDPGVFCSISIS